MRRALFPLLLLLLAAAAGAPLAALNRVETQAQPARPQTTAQTSTVLIGQVVDGDTGEAIADAVVTLTGRPAPARGRRAGGPAATDNIFDLIAAQGLGRGSADRVGADAEGRFVFRDLPASRYTLRAEAPGYLPAAGGLTGRGGGPATVEIAAGETTARVAVRLVKEAVLTGVVLDEAAEPIIRARVTAYRRNISRFGEVTYNQSETAFTDDRGEYRMYGVLPGTYLVGVPQRQATALAAGADAMLQSLMSGEMPAGGLGNLASGSSPMDPNAVQVGEWRLSSNNVQSPPAAAGAPMRAYRTVYHPAALSAAAAASVTLRSGEERSGIDFVLAPVVTGRITGTVLAPSGPVANMPVRAVAADDTFPGSSSLPEVATGQTSADGTFTLLAVPPGQYRVVAQREAPPDLDALPDELAANPMIKMALAMRGAAPPLYGDTVVSVGDGETVDVAITGSEGVVVTGQVEFEGAPPPADDIAQVRVQLRSLGGAAAGNRAVRLDRNGRFTAEGVLPGRYAASAAQAGGGRGGGPWLVSAVTAGGRDATTTPIVIENEDVAIAVTLTNRAGTLRGTVRRDASQGLAPTTAAPPVLTAILVPANYTAWTDFTMAADRIRFSPVGEDDTFRLGPMLTGEYLVAVVDEAAIDLSGGLAALQAITAQATRVTISAGDANSVTVAVAGGRR